MNVLNIWTTLSNLQATMINPKITVRVFKVWTATDPKTGARDGIESILIDSEGTAIEAVVENGYTRFVEPKLVEGTIVDIKYFGIAARRRKYKTRTVKHRYHLYLNDMTEIKQRPDISDMPVWYFDFIPIERITSESVDGRQIIDTIGQIRRIRPIRIVPRDDINSQVREIEISNERGIPIRVFIWGDDDGDNFEVDSIIEKSRTEPVIIALSSVQINLYRGLYLSTYYGTRMYFEDSIPNYNAIRTRYQVSPIPVEQPGRESAQNRDSPMTVSIKQLLEQYTQHRNEKFSCDATICDIDVPSDWYYDACKIHFTELEYFGKENYRCDSCEGVVTTSVPWYRITMIVSDNGIDKAEFVILGTRAEHLVGCTAYDLELEHGLANPRPLPPRLTNLIGQKLNFQVKYMELIPTIRNPVFTVARVTQATTDTPSQLTDTEPHHVETAPTKTTNSSRTGLKRSADSTISRGKEKIDQNHTTAEEQPSKKQASKKLVIGNDADIV